MLMLRLQRIGKKKSPSYRLIVSEKTKDTQAGTLENLGVYNPTASPKIINLKKDRIEHWLSKGAQTSASVNNILVNVGIVTGEKRKSVFLSKKRQEKLGAKAAEKEATKKAEETATAPAAAPEQIEEKPIEEVKAPEPPGEEKKEETQEKVESKE